MEGDKGKAWNDDGIAVGSNGAGVGKQVGANVPVEPLEGDSNSQGGEATVSVDGKFTVWLEWQGGGIPTKKCYLRVSPRASASVEGKAMEQASWHLTANNGITSKDNDGSPTSPNYIGFYDTFGGLAHGYDPLEPDRIIPIDTGSQRSINGKEIDLSPSASGTLTTTKWGDRYYGGHIGASISVSAVPMNYRVQISSAMEPSSERGTDGQPKPHKRDDDGKMKADSVALWIGSADSFSQGKWVASPTFSSSADDFTSPLFKWNYSGGTYAGTPSIPTGYVTDSSISFPFWLSGDRYTALELSTDISGDSLPETSVDVDVVEGTSSASNITVSNSYKVQWHRPAENWVLLSKEELTGVNADRIALESVTGKIGTSLKYTPTSKNHAIDYGKGLGIAGTAVGGFEGAFYFLSPVAMSEPHIALGIFASAALGATSLIVGSPPEQEKETVEGAASYEAYKAAVLAQESQGDYPDGTPRFSPADRIAEAKDAFKDQIFVDDENPDNDDNIARGVTVSGNAITDKTRETWECDEWGGNGYAGRNGGHVTKPKAPFTRVTFTASGSPDPTEPDAGEN